MVCIFGEARSGISEILKYLDGYVVARAIANRDSLGP
jgi:hypothetical protein